MRRIQIAIRVLLVMCFAATAQGQCTDRGASQKSGSWNAKNKFGDQFANGDRTFPRSQYPLILSKADKVIAMLRAIPGPIGVEAQPVRSISGEPYVKDGPVPFSVNVPIFDYYCIPQTSGDPNLRGRIELSGETGTWIYFYFNSVGWLANERMVRGHTTNGARIYEMPKQNGTVKGFPLLLPELNVGSPDEAIVITADGSSPFKPLSREKYLQARQKSYQDEIDKSQRLANPSPSLLAQRQSELAAITNLLNSMSPEEKQAQAIINNMNALPGKRWEKVFVTEAEGGHRLVTIDAGPFKPTSSRTAVKITTVYWRTDRTNPAKSAAIRQFKENFDFQALRQMLDQ